jgi:hypothetical protein
MGDRNRRKVCGAVLKQVHLGLVEVVCLEAINDLVEARCRNVLRLLVGKAVETEVPSDVTRMSEEDGKVWRIIRTLGLSSLRMKE